MNKVEIEDVTHEFLDEEDDFADQLSDLLLPDGFVPEFESDPPETPKNA